MHSRRGKSIKEKEIELKQWKKHFYMDDGLPSTNSIGMRKKMTELLDHGGFHLHKWLMNDAGFLQASQ